MELLLVLSGSMECFDMFLVVALESSAISLCWSNGLLQLFNINVVITGDSFAFELEVSSSL